VQFVPSPFSFRPIFCSDESGNNLDHVAPRIVNANHGIMCAAVLAGVADCIAGSVWLAIPQATEWQRIGNQINAAMIFTRADFVNVL
jgi:hypothetical protein